MNFKNSRKHFALIGAAALTIQVIWPILSPAEAGPLSNTYVRLSRMKATENTGFRVVFRTSAVDGTEDKVRITFPSYTVNATQTVSSASCASETGATALPGTLTAAGDNTAKTVVVSGVSDLATSTSYCVDLTSASALTNPVAGQYTGTVATLTSADATIDYLDVGLRVISDDQIVVSAIVPPTFNFVLSGNTDAFSTNLDPGSVVSTGGRSATITTNASKGWITWVKDNQQGLNSATAPYTIATAGTVDGSPTTLTSGTEGYVLDADITTDAAGGGTVTVDPEYNGLTTAQGGTFSGTFQPIATANGTANGDVITLIERAAIAGSTPAGNDYTDTLTVVAAGNF